MIAIFVILSAVTAAALVYSLRMNRQLSEQINALSDRLDTLSKKSGKRFNKYEKKLAQQRHKQMQQAADDERSMQQGQKSVNIKDYAILQKHLSSAFGVPVKFSCDRSGKGKITFPFTTEEELEKIIGIFDQLKNA